ncbi:MAG: manganese efflux pump MntP family protein [Clostridia bacterium]
MSLIELVLLAFGLAMDAFAVSLCRGLVMKKSDKKQAVSIACCFGFFQAAMPFIGWLIGSSFSEYISDCDDWVAFFLLIFIGVNMIREALKKDEESDEKEKLNLPQLLMMGIATSIDALAIGVSFAMLKNVNIVFSCITIGLITCAISFVGVLIGKKFGDKFRGKAEILGGIILIAIAFKILIQSYL